MPVSGSIRTADRPAIAFVEKLCRALHRYGLASDRIEAAMSGVSQQLGMDAEFFATPTAIFASLRENGQTHTVLVRVDPGEVNLDKLSRLDSLMREFSAGAVPLDDAIGRLDAIINEPSRYGPALIALAFAATSAAASCFFGGGWRELFTCAVIGLAAGLMAILAPRFPSFRLVEPFTAMIAGFVATFAAAVFPPTSVYVAMCAGLIVLLPGLTLTVAINELATRNLAAGTVRLTGALMLFLQIGFGVAVGIKVGGLIFGDVTWTEPAAFPDWAIFIALASSPPAFAILFQARFRDVGWIAGAGVLAFAGARIGSQWFGMEMGAFLGALLLGVGGNLHARHYRRPASLTLIPGMLLLVPGSIGFRSLSDLMGNDVVSGMEAAFTMGITGVALVAGLLLSKAIVSPRQSL